MKKLLGICDGCGKEEIIHEGHSMPIKWLEVKYIDSTGITDTKLVCSKECLLGLRFGMRGDSIYIDRSMATQIT